MNSTKKIEGKHGTYVLGERLGAGSMGEVHQARRIADDQHFAVKLVKTQDKTSDAISENIARILREAEVLHDLNHPNILRLVDWGLIQRVHKRGDRKEYFATQTDVWKMFEIISRQRKRREIEPVIDTIRTCRHMLSRQTLGAAGAADPAVKTTRKRMDRMLDFVETVDGLYEKCLAGGPAGLRKILQWLLKAV